MKKIIIVSTINLIMTIILSGCSTFVVEHPQSTMEDSVVKVDQSQPEQGESTLEVVSDKASEDNLDTSSEVISGEENEEQEAVDSPGEEKEIVDNSQADEASIGQEISLTDSSDNQGNDSGPDAPTDIADSSTEEELSYDGPDVVEEAILPMVQIMVIGPEEVGTIIESTEITYQEGRTAFDLLLQIANDTGVMVAYSGSGSMAYVQGIQNVYQFDYGPTSGWMYVVNKEIVNLSAGSYILEEDDRVIWLYTKDLGKDIEALLLGGM